MDRKQALQSIGFGFLGALFFHLLQSTISLPNKSHRDTFVTASAFNLVDSRGNLRAQIGFANEGPPGIWFFDEKGVARLLAGLYADQTPYFGLQDRSGRMIELMRTFGPKQTPLLIFKNEGQDMMITGLNPASEPVPFLMTYESGRQKKTHFGQYDGP